MVRMKVIMSAVQRLNLAVVGLSFLLFLAGCSRMDRSQVGRAIQLEMRIHGDVYLYLDIGRIGNCETIDPQYSPEPYVLHPDPETIPYVAAQKAGLVTISQDGNDYWKVELTDLGRSLSEKLPHDKHAVKNGCDYHSMRFPVARQELIEMSRVRGDSERTEAEYKWKWKSLEAANRLKASLSPAQIRTMNFYLEPVSHKNDRFDLSGAGQDEPVISGEMSFVKWNNKAWLNARFQIAR
jgi:hypothetical protein